MKRLKLMWFLFGALAGLVAMAGVGALALWQINAGWQETVANHKKLERALMDRIELRDRQDMDAAGENAAVKTVLIENPYQGALRSAWTIPGRVEPHTDDGRLGAYYGYLDSSGRVDRWYQPSRDEAPAVLDATMSQVPPVPPAPAAATGGQPSVQQLLNTLRAIRDY